MPNARQYYLEVARLHVEGINQGFLPTLGEKFLALLYESLDEASDAILITESKDGRVIGFVSGASCLRPIYKHMLLKCGRLAVALTPILLEPTKILRILKLIAYSFSNSRISSCGKPLPDFELLSISVARDERNAGVAQRLYERLIEYTTEHNIRGFKIVVGEDLGDAHRFYLRMGATPVPGVLIHGHQKSQVYVQPTT